MISFTTYLKRNTYTEGTVFCYERVVTKFIQWCNQMDYDLEQIKYRECTEYFGILQLKTNKYGVSLRDTTIKGYTCIIKLYFDYLVSEDIRNLNPIKDFDYVIDKGYDHELLSAIELEDLYVCFPTLDIKAPNCESVAIRDKVITGLAVYQGLDARAMKSIQIDHIDLTKRKIKVLGSKKTNARTLELKAIQMDALSNYITHDRAILQKKINCYSDGLFPLNTNRFGCLVSQLTKKLKALNYRVTNLKQIRASVITLWIQKYDLRKVQSMCGHRYITSTKRYKKNNPNTLRSAADVYHLMK